MTEKPALDAFQERMGHRFANPSLLEQALTHGSLAVASRENNQRLEFLGDRVLGLIIAEALIAHDPAATEGQLAPRFNALVRKETCADIARSIGLGQALMMGLAEQRTGGRRKDALLGDAMEAVIAALFLDAGIETAKKIVLHLWGTRIAEAEERAYDPKSALQEWAQARAMPLPLYAEIARAGSDHAPVFRVRVAVQSGQAAEAEASSKKLAQQKAAEALLEQLVSADG